MTKDTMKFLWYYRSNDRNAMGTPELYGTDIGHIFKVYKI
jgi:hypothetical protein